jgi:hypothetical protein
MLNDRELYIAGRTATDASGKYGFGGTTRAINGALECIQAPEEIASAQVPPK